MAVANCPSCGGPINFAIGSSAVVICDYCHSVVARTDRGLEDLGKVAALIDTGSVLRRDLPGNYRGVGFRLMGRTQMRHQAGGMWEEWYGAFDDGRWGWLAEAAGKYYITFQTAAKGLPTFEQIEVGGRLGDLVVQETGTAALISGEGEIPWRVTPGDTYDYADLSGPNRRFATIDYSEDAPLLFEGQETTLDELGIKINLEPRREGRVKVERLNCSNCGGPLNLVAPDEAERIVCPNCGAAHDVTSEGNLKFLELLKQRGPKPLVPLGAKGKIGDVEYVVAGFMQRSVTVDDEKYYWTEYLLYNAKAGFRWLVDSDDHWSFVDPIAAGDVKENAKTLEYGGKTYRIYSAAKAVVEYVVGEFYWKVQVGEAVGTVDYIAPPEGVSKETSGTKKAREVNYSHARYMPVDEVEQAFAVKGLPRPSKVGMLQPYTGRSISDVWAKLVGALFLVAILLAVTRPRREVFNQLYDFANLPPAADAPANQKNTRVIFTPPFQLSGKNLEIDGYSQVTNSWVYVGGDIGSEGAGVVEGFELPLEFYEGYDDGEHWTEGSRSHRTYVAAMPKGTYTMRLEAQWDEKTTPPPVMIVVREGVFRWTHFWLALVFITIPAILFGFRKGRFESARWADAGYTAAGTKRDDEEE